MYSSLEIMLFRDLKKWLIGNHPTRKNWKNYCHYIA